jgi:hypothetical protein
MQTPQEQNYHQLHAGVISRDTLMPLSVIASTVVSVVGFVWWLSGKFETMENRLERIEFRMDDSFSRSQHEAWALRLARDNPTIRVPDVR